jgi:hypothetical protein
MPSFGVTQHFADEVDWILDLAVGVRLPTLDDDSCTNHIACSRYVKLYVFIRFWATRVGGVVRYFFNSSKASCVSSVHWNLSYFFRSLKKGSPLTPSHKINLLKAAMHPVNFCMSWRLLDGFILVIADTFSGLGSIPRWEIIYLSNFSEGTRNVHLLGISFFLNFLRLTKVSARSEMSPSSS